MGAGREKDQADFDLERFIDMFDQAMVSKDPRVTDALRSLMMMVILTKPEVNAVPAVDRERGPLRRMYDDLGNINRRLTRMEDEHRQYASQERLRNATWDDFKRYPNEKYDMQVATQMASIIDQKILDSLKASSNPLGLVKKTGI